MMSKDIKGIVYAPNVIDFVTICVEYCAYLETLQNTTKEEVTDRLSKLLPLLYLKTSLVNKGEIIGDGYLESIVAEEDYNYITSKLYAIFGEDDAYLEVFMEDMKYSDTPIAASISENLGDIYQDVRNFITLYERGDEETMNDALYACIDNFGNYWGQNLVNVLRALHMIKYNTDDNKESLFDDNEINEDELW